MAFTKPEYPTARVDAAGRSLASSGDSRMQEVTEEALQVIKNWRAAHHFPLQIIKMMLKRRAKSTDPNAIVSQRMKRLPSIRNKLVRSQSATMRLSQMQDIGGCRAVVSNIDAVDSLVNLFREGVAKNPSGRHKMVSIRDYIADPKEDGYRSIHYAFRYRSASPERSTWNDLRIEIQIRSQLQHAWATAVETVDTFTGQSLKFALGSNIGDPQWRRFFALMGSAIALREKRALVPGTPADTDLTAELRHVANATQAETVLSRLSETIRVIESAQIQKDAVEYLLILNVRSKSIEIIAFSRRELPILEDYYLGLEKNADPDLQVVQVSVEDVTALRTAYPNYYLDTRAFVEALRSAVGGLPNKIHRGNHNEDETNQKPA